MTQPVAAWVVVTWVAWAAWAVWACKKRLACEKKGSEHEFCSAKSRSDPNFSHAESGSFRVLDTNKKTPQSESLAGFFTILFIAVNAYFIWARAHFLKIYCVTRMLCSQHLCGCDRAPPLDGMGDKACTSEQTCASPSWAAKPRHDLSVFQPRVIRLLRRLSGLTQGGDAHGLQQGQQAQPDFGRDHGVSQSGVAAHYGDVEALGNGFEPV